MFLFFITALTALTSANAGLGYETPSAATPAQIKFAIENKYDQTGPGATEPEYAYKTFKNLEEALLGYLDDPDTKLPDNERLKGYHQLLKKPLIDKSPIFTKYKFPEKKLLYSEPQSELGILDFNQLRPKLAPQAYVKKVHLLKQLPMKTYLRSAFDDFGEKFNPNPQYSYSYGVHDSHTGDSKSAHETRDGGTVKGYYTVTDADGKQRTVHYTADDKQGFRAIVSRVPTATHGAL